MCEVTLRTSTHQSLFLEVCDYTLGCPMDAQAQLAELNPILSKSPWGAETFQAPRPWSELLGKSMRMETGLEEFLESSLRWSPVRRLEAVELLTLEFFDPLRGKVLAASMALPAGAAKELMLFDFTSHELGEYGHLMPQLLPFRTRQERRSAREGPSAGHAEAGRDEERPTEPPATQRSRSGPGRVRHRTDSQVAGSNVRSAHSDEASVGSYDSGNRTLSPLSSLCSASFSAVESTAGSDDSSSPRLHGAVPLLPLARSQRTPRKPLDARIDAQSVMWRHSVREAQRNGTLATQFPTLRGFGSVPDTTLMGGCSRSGLSSAHPGQKIEKPA